jgi:hypothetical protein
MFLWLVGPLQLHDLDKLVWQSSVVIPGHMPSSSFEKNFYRSHSPPSLWPPNLSFNWYQGQLPSFVILTSL